MDQDVEVQKRPSSQDQRLSHQKICGIVKHNFHQRAMKVETHQGWTMIFKRKYLNPYENEDEADVQDDALAIY